MKKQGKILLAHIKYNQVFNYDNQKKNIPWIMDFKMECKNCSLGNKDVGPAWNVNHKFVSQKNFKNKEEKCRRWCAEDKLLKTQSQVNPTKTFGETGKDICKWKGESNLSLDVHLHL